MRPLEEIEALLVEHAAAPERRVAQRALAAEMTALVHGREEAALTERAAGVLFGGDAASAPPEVLAIVAAEVPAVELPASLHGLRVHELLVAAGVAASTSEVNRLLRQKAVRAGHRVLAEDGLLDPADLLPGGYLLLRKGKRDYVVGKSSPRG